MSENRQNQIEYLKIWSDSKNERNDCNKNKNKMRHYLQIQIGHWTDNFLNILWRPFGNRYLCITHTMTLLVFFRILCIHIARNVVCNFSSSFLIFFIHYILSYIFNDFFMFRLILSILFCIMIVLLEYKKIGLCMKWYEKNWFENWNEIF